MSWASDCRAALNVAMLSLSVSVVRRGGMLDTVTLVARDCAVLMRSRYCAVSDVISTSASPQLFPPINNTISSYFSLHDFFTSDSSLFKLFTLAPPRLTILVLVRCVSSKSRRRLLPITKVCPLDWSSFSRRFSYSNRLFWCVRFAFCSRNWESSILHSVHSTFAWSRSAWHNLCVSIEITRSISSDSLFNLSLVSRRSAAMCLQLQQGHTPAASSSSRSRHLLWYQWPQRQQRMRTPPPFRFVYLQPSMQTSGVWWGAAATADRRPRPVVSTSSGVGVEVIAAKSSAAAIACEALVMLPVASAEGVYGGRGWFSVVVDELSSFVACCCCCGGGGGGGIE